MPTVKKTPVKKVVKKVAVKTVVKKAVVAKAAVKKALVKEELPKETGLKLSVFNTSGKVLESILLPKEIFGVDINTQIMTQAVRVYLANQRRGTVKTKSRGEVKISTRKIYRQKGTGRARHGAASAPIFVGGGIAFGPRPRDYSLSLNQKMRRVALFSALTSKLKDGEIKIIAGLEKLEPKTNKMADVIAKLNLNIKKKQILLVIPKGGKDFENVVKAARNIEGVSILSSNLLNTYEVLSNKQILFMKNSIDGLKETFLNKN
jgi:large subunit ribosomal protein L4